MAVAVFIFIPRWLITFESANTRFGTYTPEKIIICTTFMGKADSILLHKN